VSDLEAEDMAVEVHVTTPDASSAERLARVLVEERLAACVQVVPGVRSYYRWEGAVAVDDEHLLLVKSLSSCLGAIRSRIGTEHPYDTPEVLAVPAADVEDRYFSWLKESVRREGLEATATPTEDPP
jgi:periplasmic divalent cation tolerance protein